MPKTSSVYSFRINEQIKAEEVRLIGENIELENPLVKLTDAIKLAEEMDLDLIEKVPGAKPPVCIIQEYDKFIYRLKKKNKDVPKQKDMKQVRFGPNTEENDYKTKSLQIKKFLSEKRKVLAYVFLGGGRKSYVLKPRAFKLLERLKEDIDYKSSEIRPEGNKITIIFNP